MPPTWLSIRVDLISGRGEKFWSRPGRIFAADARHTFVDLAAAIDAAFARWDRAHLFEFDFADGRRIGTPEYHDDDEGIIDGAVATLSQLTGGASSSTSSTSATVGRICALSRRHVSTRWKYSASSPPCLCRIGDGAPFPTSTAAAGQRRFIHVGWQRSNDTGERRRRCIVR